MRYAYRRRSPKNDIRILSAKTQSLPCLGTELWCPFGKVGAGRRLAAVRGGHYVPAPAGRPHGPRRCGGPEHHGVFWRSNRLSTLVPASSWPAHLRKSLWKSTIS